MANTAEAVETTRSFIELVKDEPAVMGVGVMAFMIGAILMYYVVRKGYIPTPDMTSKMKKLHEENSIIKNENVEIRIKMAHIEEELKHTRADSKKWGELLSSFLTEKRKDLLDQAAKNSGGESE